MYLHVVLRCSRRALSKALNDLLGFVQEPLVLLNVSILRLADFLQASNFGLWGTAGGGRGRRVMTTTGLLQEGLVLVLIKITLIIDDWSRKPVLSPSAPIAIAVSDLCWGRDCQVKYY